MSEQMVVVHMEPPALGSPVQGTVRQGMIVPPVAVVLRVATLLVLAMVHRAMVPTLGVRPLPALIHPIWRIRQILALIPT